MNIGYLNTKNKKSTSPLNCWDGYERVPGTKEFSKGSCRKKSPLTKKAKLAKSWTQSDRDAYNRETGSNLKPPQPGGGSRKKSYCARSAGIKKCKPSRRDKNGDCPNDIARRKWNC
tara:strand:- start:262 stop:609 length:348 start_codon:yes stop_codon:yes gene_type:complete